MNTIKSGRRNSFIGQDGFIWWIGIIVDRNDPLNCGRCKVRIKGIHSENSNVVPNETLPWAQPLNPVNNSFQSPSSLKEGELVMGFFLDGEQGQYPVIMGTLPIIPEPPSDKNKTNGFSDPRTEEQLKISPQTIKSVTYNKDGSGSTIENDVAKTYPNIFNEPTISRLSRHETIDKTIVKTKKDNVITGIQTSIGNSWDEPPIPYDAKYPYNHVIETESGHIIELDDTNGAERIHIYHRSGTFNEIHPNGDNVDKTINNKYTIILKNNMMYVMGDCDITVQKNANIYIKKDCNLKTDNNLNIDVLKDCTWNIKGNMKFNITGTMDWSINGSTKWNFNNSVDWNIGSSYNNTSGGTMTYKAPQIKLN